MSYAIFDCSQFVTFDTGCPFDLGKAEQIFTAKGFAVRTNQDIDLKKRAYFSDVFGDIILEIVDDEFLGNNFDDWSDKNDVPEQVQGLANAIEELESFFDLSGLKIILVDSADADTQKNFLVNRKMESQDLREELFFVSSKNFDLYGNVYILTR